MNFEKIDSFLASAIFDIEDEEERALVVFIQTEAPLEADQCAVLEKSGIQVGNKDRQVFTGTLSASEISELSDQSWVLNIKLSENLRLLRSSRVGHGLKVPGL
jgi:hypothetical protein